MFRRFKSYLVELRQHRGLLWQLTRRNFELRYKGSRLGFLWPFLNPLLMLALYVFVFGFIFGGSFGVLPHETPVDYSLGMLIGLAFFQFVGEVLGIGPLIVVSQPYFVKKVVLPVEILPVASVAVSIVNFFIYFAFVFIGVVFFGPGLTWRVFWIPVLMFPVVLFALGLAWLLSSWGVFYRDLGQLANFLSQVLMFGSAVFYSPKMIPPAAWMFMRFNPLLLAIDLARDAMLWNLPLHSRRVIYLYVSGLAIFLYGFATFRKLKPRFVDRL